MAVNIGPRIGIEGEDQFRREIMNITQQAKTLASEMKVVTSAFNDETSAQEKASKKSEVLTKQIGNQEQKVKMLEKGLEEAKRAYGENDQRTMKWQQAVNEANAELNKLNNELDATEKEANEYETEIKEATEGNEQFTQSIGQLMGNEKLQEFFSSASQKIAEFASSAMDAAKELDEGYDTIATKTGATGDSLEELKGIANDVYGSMPVEMADVGSAVGEVSTRFKQSGDQLRETSEQFLKFARINGTDVSDSIDSVDRVMKTFHVDASQTENVLGLLTSAAQSSGIKMDALTSQLDQNGATFAELGFSVQDAAELLATFEANGVDTSTTMTALKKSITNAAKEGKDANSVLKDAEARIKGASSETEALQIATDIFGTRGAVVMVNGLRDGRISLERTTKSLESYGSVVEDTFEATLSPWDKTKTAMNNLKTVASDLAGNALSTLVPAIEKISDVIKKVSDWFNKLSPSAQKVIGVFTAITAGAAIVGPKIMSVVTTLKQLKAASDLTKSLQSMGGEMQTAGGSANFLSTELGAVTVGVTAGITAVLALTEAEKAWRRATDENYGALSSLADENKRFLDEAERSRGALDDLKSSYSFNSDEIDRLSGRLLELNDKQSLTAEEAEEYRVIVAKLEQALPGFSGEIDESTGKLKDQTQATKDNIDALKEMAKQEAAVSGMADAIKQSTEASMNQKKVLDNMREAMMRMGASADYSDEQLLEFARNANTSSGIMGTLKDSFGVTQQYMSQLNNALAYGADAYDEYGAQIEEADALIAEYSTYTDEAATATDELGTETVTTAEEIAASQEEIQKAYEETAAAARKTLDEQSGLFKKFEYDTNVSIDSIEEALESQTQAYATWSANATAVMEDTRYGTDANFTAMANTILNMGMEGASYLKTFVDAAQSEDGRLEGVLNDFGAASVAQQAQANVFASWEQQFADFANGTTGTLLNATPGVAEAGYQFGSAAPTGTAQGMEDNAGAVESAGGTLANKMIKAVGKMAADSEAKSAGKAVVAGVALGIAGGLPKLVTAISNLVRPIKNIPTTITGMSTAVRLAGMSVASGLASGMTANSGLVSSAATTLANAAKISVSSSTYNSQGQSIAQGFANGISNNKNLVKTAAESAANAAKITVRKEDYTYVGTAIAAGFAQGITNSKFVVESAAKGAVSSAIQAAKKRAGIQSPSKEFAYLGEMSAAGYAVGLKDSAGMISRATQKMVSIPDASSVAGGRGGVSNSYSSSYGDIVVNVSGANVSDPARLADMVADRINRQVLSRKAAFA